MSHKGTPTSARTAQIIDTWVVAFAAEPRPVVLFYEREHQPLPRVVRHPDGMRPALRFGPPAPGRFALPRLLTG
jgi:hypothetical protein